MPGRPGPRPPCGRELTGGCSSPPTRILFFVNVLLCPFIMLVGWGVVFTQTSVYAGFLLRPSILVVGWGVVCTQMFVYLKSLCVRVFWWW